MADDLLNLFATMGTSDHNELIGQFKQVLPGTDDGTAQFFLEANNWTLQAAVESFFDYGGNGVGAASHSSAPMADFVCDVTVGEGEEIPPGVTFDKTWRLRNTGMEAWPASTSLVMVQGDQMSAVGQVPVPQLQPNSVADISVTLTAPHSVGQYANVWRLCHVENGMPAFFGEQIWAIITVAEGGTLPITQKLHDTSFQAHTESMMAQGVATQGGDGHFPSALHPHPLGQADSSAPWLCDARQHPQGCKREHQEMVGVPRFACMQGCDFSICVDCLRIQDAGGFTSGTSISSFASPESNPFVNGGQQVTFGSLSQHTFGQSANMFGSPQ